MPDTVVLVAVKSGDRACSLSEPPTSGTAKTPKPRTTAVYPVEFPGWDKPSPRPRPTVSYPIRFDDADG